MIRTVIVTVTVTVIVIIIVAYCSSPGEKDVYLEGCR